MNSKKPKLGVPDGSGKRRMCEHRQSAESKRQEAQGVGFAKDRPICVTLGERVRPHFVRARSTCCSTASSANTNAELQKESEGEEAEGEREKERERERVRVLQASAETTLATSGSSRRRSGETPPMCALAEGWMHDLGLCLSAG